VKDPSRAMSMGMLLSLGSIALRLIRPMAYGRRLWRIHHCCPRVLALRMVRFWFVCILVNRSFLCTESTQNSGVYSLYCLFLTYDLCILTQYCYIATIIHNTLPIANVHPVQPNENAQSLWGDIANPKTALEENGFQMRHVVLTARRRN
jgi:hypothetical protein